MGEINGDRLRGHLATMVLSVLEKGDAHGFEILRRLEAQGSGLLRLKEGSLYPALYRLEQAGCIRGKWEDNVRRARGPRRRIYRLTRKGKRELASGRAEWAEFAKALGRIIGVPS